MDESESNVFCRFLRHEGMVFEFDCAHIKILWDSCTVETGWVLGICVFKNEPGQFWHGSSLSHSFKDCLAFSAASKPGANIFSAVRSWPAADMEAPAVPTCAIRTLPRTTFITSKLNTVFIKGVRWGPWKDDLFPHSGWRHSNNSYILAAKTFTWED